MWILGLAVLLGAPACNTAQEPNDPEIVKEIQSELFANSDLKGRDISVESEDGSVTLSGTVASDAERTEVAALVREVEGVKQVTIMLDVAEPETEEVAAAPEPEPAPAPRRRKTPVRRASAPRPQPVRAPAPAPAPVVAPEPAPVRAAAVTPKRAPQPLPPVRLEIPAGTLVSIRLIDPIDAAKNQPGDEFAASLASALTVSGRMVADQGSDAVVTLVDSKTSGRIKGRSELIVELATITVAGREYSVQSDSHVHQGGSRGRNTAKKVGGGAVLGSVIGAIAGGKKGAAIGGAIGAGAGTAAQAATKGKQARLESETRLDFTLETSVSVTLAAGR